ncbi:MAG TPA: 4-alpha-glucanotransferase [Blastocatellia bacterium]|nr:4-alpha-glucanotransferase [Blastocatellia bacterium]
MEFRRSSGILLHPTSLAAGTGIGDLGPAAYEFVDFLSSSAQSLWQVLPLGPTGYGDSPYQCFSSFAGNTLLISLERLVEQGLLSKDDLAHAPSSKSGRIDYGSVIKFKTSLLYKAFARFKHAATPEMRQDFEHFSRFARSWLDDYALFRAIGSRHDNAVWNRWEPDLARRKPEAIEQARRELGEEIELQRFFQYLFFRQWSDLKTYSGEKGVKIIGDMPIFVAHNSSDLWTHPDLFKLDEEGNPTVVAGVPPDYFSKTGQLWGNPLYDWDRMREKGFEWWIGRMRLALQLFDIVRIDHFRAFAATWEVPAGDETAENGEWVEVPGREFFAALNQEFGELPIIAEDLGLITPDVIELRDELGFPGMRVLQFAFGSDSRDMHLPHNYIKNTVVYTGTHDSDTVVGWFTSEEDESSTRDAEQIERERDFCLKYLNTDGKEIHWDFIRAAFSSVAAIAIVQMQDLLGLDSHARMNIPASEEGNWSWRMPEGALSEGTDVRLRDMTWIYGRAPGQDRPPDEDKEAAPSSGEIS